MQSHTAIAGQCLGEVAQRLGGSNFLELARTIALAHHERWDGSGYPDGLKGERIPLAARIVAIADVYDALVTSRIYKGALSHEEAIVAISAAAGKQFDPAPRGNGGAPAGHPRTRLRDPGYVPSGAE